MIVEVNDPSIINTFANHPSIRPWLAGGDGPLDFSGGLHGSNVFLFGDHGGFCFGWPGPGTFEVHVMLGLSGKGKWGVEAGKLAIQMMAARGMTHLWGRIHPDRPEMAVYARLCGMKDTGEINPLDVGNGPVDWRIFNWRREC